MQWCLCSWTAPQFSVPCNRRRNTKYVSHPLRRSGLQETKKPSRNIQGTTTLWCSPGRQRQRKTFYPASVLRVELVLVFPIKGHFYINCPEQQGIGKLTQSLPRTKDDIGVTCLLLQKTLFIKGNRESRETIDSSLYPCTGNITATFWSPTFFTFFPPREVNFTAAQATAFN